jgi:NAD(P)-dependent dehydrogenase (short-subunit alcohol dehydrogenase family)
VKKYTFMQRKEDVVREWHHYDAEGQILGRLAVEVAKKLMGKDKLTFTPHIDGGDFVVVTNVAKIMVTQGSGKIINVASMLSFQGGKFVPPYTASKHGVAGLTKAFANELACKNIQVNAIAPGYIKTANTAPIRADEKRNAEILSRIPADKWAEPSELMGAIVFLASRASDYVNGHILAVDGGWLVR